MERCPEIPVQVVLLVITLMDQDVRPVNLLHLTVQHVLSKMELAQRVAHLTLLTRPTRPVFALPVSKITALLASL